MSGGRPASGRPTSDGSASGSSAAAHPALLDADNPWPGLAAFDEASRRFFYGREAEVDELLHRIEQAPVTVLFGQSGLGKSSLLRAGLMPALRERHVLPVLVRIDWRAGAPEPEQQLREALQAVLRNEQIEAPALADGESLWAWLHRDGLELWDNRNFPCTPLFLIDQFEEVFTLGEHVPERVAHWRSTLGDLAENRIPAELGEAAAASAGLQLRAMRYKLLISLREDFLPELEGWRRALPALGRNRMRLLPLRPAQAVRAVLGPGAHLMDAALARRVVQFVAAAQLDLGEAATGSSPGSSSSAGTRSGPTQPDASANAAQLAPADADAEARADATADTDTDAESSAPGVNAVRIEPALLSLFCRGLNERRQRLGQARFDDALLDGAKQGILSDYYSSCFEGMPPAVSRFVASELITEKGYRNSVSKDDATPAHLTEAQLAQLIDRRLLRVEERYGALRIELTHDLLTRVVREHRDRLRREAAEVQRASEATAAALAERTALEAQMRQRESELQAERLRQAQGENRRFKLLLGALGLALVLAMAMAAAAWFQRDQVMAAQQQAMAAKDVEQKLRVVAEQQIVVAEQQRAVAEARFQRLAKDQAMKRAVLAGDQAAISGFIATAKARPNPPWRPGFAASATPYGYKNQGRAIYNFRLMPTPKDLPKMREQVTAVTFRMDHPSFRNGLLVTGPERDYSASYDGWGCLSTVVVLIEYQDPDRASEIDAYDMCAALGW